MNTTPPHLDIELEQQLDAYLPAQHSATIRAAFEELNTRRTETANLEADIERHRQENRQLSAANRELHERGIDVERDQQQTADQAQTLTHREQICDLREEHTQHRINDMRSLLQDFLGAATLDYRFTGAIPMTVDSDETPLESIDLDDGGPPVYAEKSDPDPAPPTPPDHGTR